MPCWASWPPATGRGRAVHAPPSWMRATATMIRPTTNSATPASVPYGRRTAGRLPRAAPKQAMNTAAIRTIWMASHPSPRGPSAGSRLTGRSGFASGHTYHVEPAVYVNNFARHCRRQVRRQVQRRARDILDGDVAADGCHVAETAVHRLEVAHAWSSQRPDRSGGNGVDADARRTQVDRQVANARFEGGLCHAHNVVVGDHLLRPVVGQRDDRPAFAHVWLRGAHQADQRIGADVQSQREAFTRCVHE